MISLYLLGFACAPLALFVPPPRRVAANAYALCRLLLRLALALVVLAGAIMAYGPLWAGLSLGAVALVSLMLMFWAAAEPRRREHPDQEDEGPGGNGGTRTPALRPRDPDAPGGLAIDWHEFDRLREGWHDAPEPATIN